jgi:hypothetical protein
MEWKSQVVRTEHYAFELKIGIDKGTITNCVLLVGDERRPCLHLIIPVRTSNNRLVSKMTTATLPNLEGLRECLSEEVANDYFRKNSFPKEMLRHIIRMMKVMFPHITRINLSDMSYIPCNRLEGDKLDLFTYSLALYGKTWYEINFGAVQNSPKYSAAINAYLGEKPIDFENWYSLVKTYNLYAKYWIDQTYNQIKDLFETSQTYPEFYQALSKLIGFSDKCKVFNGWLLQFMIQRIPNSRSWHIPLRQSQRGGRKRTRTLRK